MGIIGVVLFAIAGFALTNGMPHFVAGLGGRVFRTPFGRYSSPCTNVAWGMTNFVIAIGLLFGRSAVADPTTGDIVWFVVGALLCILSFAFGAKGFFDDRDARPDGSGTDPDGSRRAPDGSRGAADSA
ncbi:hypothetical protein GA0004736_1492 [Curtobacterium sp. 9128]|uniref:hypothetical protein n=1 Tax=Curtobacterium sp. 9128 TaxID=1793722 RepID=UPI0007D71B6A|nr:hypothetical protein [Curtobacterium sp. 9128]SBN62589.1 hypothetical protein GA0004736_1492 [Curtobacterium sp. 9128]